jgi:hypothetical protein
MSLWRRLRSGRRRLLLCVFNRIIIDQLGLADADTPEIPRGGVQHASETGLTPITPVSGKSLTFAIQPPRREHYFPLGFRGLSPLQTER